MALTRLILVGGFLGAGKTTLLWEAARRIMSEGQRVGLITNDQAPDLVDTAILSHHDVKVAEVSGSCFCCNFGGFVNAMQQVRREANADVILAEPVGSCTDLSATILQPLKENMGRTLLTSPLSVLADPLHLIDILEGGTAGLHSSAAYIFWKQLEESDIILISKSDLIGEDEMNLLIQKVKVSFPDAEVMTISSVTGEGIDKWLKEVMYRTDAGQRIVAVDYDIYAEGEAVLGWLNCTVELSGPVTEWDIFGKKLLESLSRKFDESESSVGHVKLILESGDKFLKGNLTGKLDTLNFSGSAGRCDQARLTLNVRVQMTPGELEVLVRQTLAETAGDATNLKIVTLRCLSPGRPNPTYRFSHIATVNK